jgi:hypothetical protein
MQVYVPILNPIRFYRYLKLPDYTTYWPNMDNVIPGTEYCLGMEPVNYYTDWVINNQINIQLRVISPGTENLLIYKMNTTTGAYALYATIIPTVITPTGWIDEKVNKYTYTFSEVGTYYFWSASAGIKSVKFVVHSDLKFKERLVKITYQNTFNDFDVVFWDSTTLKYSGLCFFTGRLMQGGPGNTISAFKSNRNNITKLRSTPFRVTLLQLVEINYAEIDRINHILSCDTLTVNGISYELEEISEAEPISGTDLFKMNIKLTQKLTNYFITD